WANENYVALYAAGLAGSAGHGNVKREACLRTARHGIELFQSRLDRQRRRHWLVARSALRRALPHWPRHWHARRRAVAINRAVSLIATRWLQLSRRLPLARPRRPYCPYPDGSGGDRGQCRAGECTDQQRICRQPRQWPGELAQYRVSFDAI